MPFGFFSIFIAFPLKWYRRLFAGAGASCRDRRTASKCVFILIGRAEIGFAAGSPPTLPLLRIRLFLRWQNCRFCSADDPTVLMTAVYRHFFQLFYTSFRILKQYEIRSIPRRIFLLLPPGFSRLAPPRFSPYSKSPFRRAWND